MDRRIKIIFTLFCIWFIILGCRLWYMQVFQQTRYKNLSIKNRTRFVRLQSGRGKIYDRNGILIADNKPATQLVVVVGEIEDRKNALAKEHLNFKHDYNEHCIEQVHIHNQVAEKFLADEMNANFFTTKNYVQNDEEAPF